MVSEAFSNQVVFADHPSFWRLNKNTSQAQRKNNADSLIRDFFSFNSSTNNNQKVDLEEMLSLPNPNTATEQDKNNINNQIYQSLANSCQTIEMTDYAIEKAEYVVQRFKELREERGISSSYEIAFQMIGDIGSNTIDDVFIDLDQQVNNTRCTMKASSSTSRKIKRQNKEILAWGHSHTNFDTFLVRFR